MWIQIEWILGWLSRAINLVTTHHSQSLIYTRNNNYVEEYISVVAKCVGGKRINYSLKGNYNLFKAIYYIT